MVRALERDGTGCRLDAPGRQPAHEARASGANSKSQGLPDVHVSLVAIATFLFRLGGGRCVRGRARALAAKIGFEMDQCLEVHGI